MMMQQEASSLSSMAPPTTVSYSNSFSSAASGGGGGGENRTRSEEGHEGEQEQLQEAALEDALDDVQTRFLLNLPENELATADRLFFQLEQAFWFYDDFLCDSQNAQEEEGEQAKAGGVLLPRFKHLQPFARRMFEFSPLLQPLLPQFDRLWREFLAYKRSISTYGTILLNADCTKLVLCKDYWTEKSWTFPSGKVNQNEAGIETAARETYEETGFDPHANAGRARLLRQEAQARNEAVPWTCPLRPEDALVYTEEGNNNNNSNGGGGSSSSAGNSNAKRRTCFVCVGVPEDFAFAPVCRKEVSEVGWFDLDQLPKRSYGVLPFMGQLRQWIRKRQLASHKKKGGRSDSAGRNARRPKSRDRGGGSGSAKSTPSPASSMRKGTLVAASTAVTTTTAPHFPSALHQNRNQHDNHDDDLQPFFSNQGVTPWGEVVTAALAEDAVQQATSRRGGGGAPASGTPFSTLTMNNQKDLAKAAPAPPPSSTTEDEHRQGCQAKTAPVDNNQRDDDDDNEAHPESTVESPLSAPQLMQQMSSLLHSENTTATTALEDEHYRWLQQWVQQLPQSPSTKRFGDFRFDVSTVLEQTWAATTATTTTTTSTHG